MDRFSCLIGPQKRYKYALNNHKIIGNFMPDYHVKDEVVRGSMAISRRIF